MPEDSARPSRPPSVEKTLLHEGGWANAMVWRCRDEEGAEWVEKDFSPANWLVRNTLGRFLVAREAWVLGRLSGTGVVPEGVRKISAVSLREDVVPGFALRDSACGAYRGNVFDPTKVHGLDPDTLRQEIPSSFFDALEAGLRACHAAGFVHLDIHNARNVMVTPGFRPVVLDWQSALPVRFMPRPFRRMLEKIDLAGVAKFRAKFRPADISSAQRRRLRRLYFLRRVFWLPRVQLRARSGNRSQAPKD